jgi:hypothetical protein
VTVKSGSPSFLFAGVANVLAWLAFAIANVRLTLGAGG